MMRALVVLALFAPWAVSQSVVEHPPWKAGLLGGVFVENHGQWDGPARLVAQVGDLLIGAEPGALIFCVRREVEPGRQAGAVWRLSLDGGLQGSEPVGAGAPGAPRHFLKGRDSASWQTSVSAWTAVHYRQAWPGVDLTLDLASGTPVLGLLAEDPASLTGVRLRSEGHQDLAEQSGGALRASAGAVVWRLTAVDQGAALRLQPAASPDGLERDDSRRILLAPAPQSSDVVRPHFGLEWATFLGGESTGSSVMRLALTPDNGVIVGGKAFGQDFPVSAGAFDTTFGGGSGFAPSDCFIACLSPDAQELEWATFLGGDNNDVVQALLVDDDSQPVIAGRSGSTDYPTTPGAFSESQVLGEGFVSKLTADGSALAFSTLLGGSKGDWINDMAWDEHHDLVLAGLTQSLDFPVTAGAVQSTSSGGDAFVARLSGDGTTLHYATYFGNGSGNALAVAVAASGLVYLAGGATTGFPVTPGAYSTEYLGSGGDAFVSCLDITAGRLVASTLLGGDWIEVAYDLVIDPLGRPVVTGYTDGDSFTLESTFPVTADAYDPVYNGFEDVFVSRFDPALETLEYSTFVGGVRRDFGRAMVVEPSGAVVVAGTTDAHDFPVTPGSTQPVIGNPESAISYDLFVFRLSPDGRSLRYSTYLGGEATEIVSDTMGLVVDAAGAAILGGITASDDFPTTPDSYNPTKTALADSVIARLSLLPRGATAYGASTPGCSGPSTIGVTSLPFTGNGRFAVTCGAGPPSAAGLLAIGLGELETPVSAGGALAWVDPAALLILLPVSSDAIGNALAELPLPADGALVGATAYAQFFWANDCPPGPLAASNALEVVVQPALP